MTRRYPDQRLRLPLLRAVDAVDAHGSLLKASAVLGITQPALTKSLQELEDIVQARLFDRHSRGMRTTEAGLVFVQTARRILAELRRLDEELDQLSSPGGGTVALGALPVAAAGVLPGVLARLKTTDPDKGAASAGPHRGPAAAARIGRDRPDRRAALRARGAGRLRARGDLDRADLRSRPHRAPNSFRGGGDGRRAAPVRARLADRQPAGRAGDRTSARSLGPAADDVSALQLLRVHSRDAARHGPHRGHAAADDGRRPAARNAESGATAHPCAGSAGRADPAPRPRGAARRTSLHRMPAGLCERDRRARLSQYSGGL